MQPLKNQQIKRTLPFNPLTVPFSENATIASAECDGVQQLCAMSSNRERSSINIRKGQIIAEFIDLLPRIRRFEAARVFPALSEGTLTFRRLLIRYCANRRRAPYQVA